MRPLIPLLLATSALLLAFGMPAQAGTEAAPEITDTPDDQAGPNGVAICQQDPVGCQTGGSLDILAGWIDNETATTVQFNLRVAVAPAAGAQYNHYWAFKVNTGAEVVGGAMWIEDDAVAPFGSASAAVITDTLIAITVPKSAFGAATELTGMSATATRNLLAPANATLVTDVAPDSGTSTAVYPLGGGPNTDSDADGLNDTFEQQYFGNLDEESTGDPDGDGLSNAEEQALGTDPTMEDTDGDGFSDKEERDAETDPLDPSSKPTSAPPPPPPTGTPPPPSPSPTGSPPIVPPSPVDTTDEGDDETVDTLDEAIDGIKAEQDYFSIAAIGAAGVILISLIALLGRWGV